MAPGGPLVPRWLREGAPRQTLSPIAPHLPRGDCRFRRADPHPPRTPMLAPLALIAAAAATVACAPAAAQDTQVVAFTNVTVVPMDSERALPAQTVIVRGDR